LFDGHEVIVMPHGVDRSVYQPWDQAMARSILQLPQGKLVMFSAAKGLQTPHKNVAAVHRILGFVKQQLPEVNLVVMGAGPPSGVPEETGLHYLGHLHDDVSRALAFAAVDALLIPSKEEAFGNVVLESLACGTPVAAYATGAAPDLLRDERCGTAVAIGDEPGLVEALLSLLSRDDTDRQVVRAATDGHGLSDMAAAYRDLYQRLCGTA
jgi:glycosyltransferase involved in cell wall biosynthesis